MVRRIKIIGSGERGTASLLQSLGSDLFGAVLAENLTAELDKSASPSRQGWGG